jgi:hypothetical protein
LNSIDTSTTESFTRFLKIEQQYRDNYCGQLLKLLKIILRDAEKSGLEVHPYSNYMASFKQKSLDRILPVLNPIAIKSLKKLKQIPKFIKIVIIGCSSVCLLGHGYQIT